MGLSVHSQHSSLAGPPLRDSQISAEKFRLTTGCTFGEAGASRDGSLEISCNRQYSALKALLQLKAS